MPAYSECAILQIHFRQMHVWMYGDMNVILLCNPLKQPFFQHRVAIPKDICSTLRKYEAALKSCRQVAISMLLPKQEACFRMEFRQNTV